MMSMWYDQGLLVRVSGMNLGNLKNGWVVFIYMLFGYEWGHLPSGELT